MMHFHKTAAGVIAGTLLCAGLAVADPPADWPEAYIAAGEVVIDETYYVSEPFYNGSYYVSSVRPHDGEFCRLDKTLEDYSAEGELTKKTVTTYDFASVDPASIKMNMLGGVEFYAYDKAPVFRMQVAEGGDFGTDIPGDTVGASKEAAGVAALIDALETIAESCVPASEE